MRFCQADITRAAHTRPALLEKLSLRSPPAVRTLLQRRASVADDGQLAALHTDTLTSLIDALETIQGFTKVGDETEALCKGHILTVGLWKKTLRNPYRIYLRENVP
jgi:hypothetical protein